MKKIIDQKNRILNNITINENGCWIWNGNKDKRNGYARIKYGGGNKQILVHRLSYQEFIGPIPQKTGHHGICVLHSCDVRACCNPAHLFLGTHKDNMLDMCRKGKHHDIKGELCSASILTEKQVLEIREKALKGYKVRDIINEYNIGQTQYYNIIKRKSWKHI